MSNSNSEETILTTSPMFKVSKLNKPFLSKKMVEYQKYAIPKFFSKGECIINVGENPTGVHYIKKGTVNIVIRSRNGTEKVLIIADEYYFLGGECLFHRQPVQYFAITKNPVQTYWFEKNNFFNILKSDFDIAQDVMYDMALRARVLARQIEDILFVPTFERAVKLLYYCSTLQATSSYKISQQDLASLLGVHRNSLGSIISELKQLGIVETEYASIHIKDPVALKKLVMTCY